MMNTHYHPDISPVNNDSLCFGKPVEPLCHTCRRYAPNHTTAKHMIGVPEIVKRHCRLYQSKG